MNPETSRRLVDVFVLRTLAAESQLEDAHGARQLGSCLALYGAVPLRSYLTADGRRMLCHFHAPDADSLRSALRGARIEYDAIWSAGMQARSGATDSTHNRTLASTLMSQS